jgi:two-component system sensor histidine kinase DegS
VRRALDSAMKQMTAGTGLQAQFTTRGKPRRLTASGEENLLRIYVEILTNALKHSGAKVIKGTLSFEEDAVRLEVKDDGGGFDLAKEHDGLGLLGIRERVNQMNGKLTVESRVGSGTRICVALPNQARLADGEPH